MDEKTQPLTHDALRQMTPAQISNAMAKQRVPQVRGPLPVPPPPPSTEQWSFRDVRGTRETIKGAILAARLTDPVTRKPGNEPLPAPVVAYLLWILDNREGDIFSLDGHVHAADKTEWSEHLHLKRWA